MMPKRDYLWLVGGIAADEVAATGRCFRARSVWGR